nr:MAG TPA: hypothetical protein [Caudoviricetes sp.]
MARWRKQRQRANKKGPIKGLYLYIKRKNRHELAAWRNFFDLHLIILI